MERLFSQITLTTELVKPYSINDTMSFNHGQEWAQNANIKYRILIL